MGLSVFLLSFLMTQESFFGYLRLTEASFCMDACSQYNIETEIDSDCAIIMPSTIGKNCKIKKNVRIGPYASIGDNTIISSNVKIENSIIMSNCKIEDGLKINNSIISSNCHLEGNNRDDSEKLFLLGEGTRISL